MNYPGLVTFFTILKKGENLARNYLGNIRRYELMIISPQKKAMKAAGARKVPKGRAD